MAQIILAVSGLEIVCIVVVKFLIMLFYKMQGREKCRRQCASRHFLLCFRTPGEVQSTPPNILNVTILTM